MARKKKLSQRDIVLAAMAAGAGTWFAPVHVQKLFFLVDKKIGAKLGGPFFNFVPYAYGPFDKAVYRTLERLQEGGLVEIVRVPYAPHRQYQLSVPGQSKGEAILESLDEKASDFLRRLAKYVSSTPFATLVSAIYEAYPSMKKNSIFVHR